MILAHKIRLNATCKQRAYFARAAGTARLVWNWALAEWERQYRLGEKPTGASLKKQFNKVKYELYSWLKGIHRDAHSAPFANLQKAFVRYFQKKANRPKFKKRDRSHDSFAVSNDRLTVKGDRIRLPLIGWVKLAESIRFPGRIISAVVNRTADHWYISFQIDVGEVKKKRVSNAIVGVDLGIKTLAITSDGQKVEALHQLKYFIKKLANMQRRLARKVKGSHRRAKLKGAIARLHATITNIRRDCLHKLTTKLCRENQTVVIEDLCVKGMLANRKLSRAIANIGFYEFRRQLKYKSEMYGTELVFANRFYPSSKTCSNCKSVKTSLALSERTYKCGSCGLEIDRDLNAAKNLCTLGFRETNARGPEGSGFGCKTGSKPRRDEARTKPCPTLDKLREQVK